MMRDMQIENSHDGCSIKTAPLCHLPLPPSAKMWFYSPKNPRGIEGKKNIASIMAILL
jgi:hypothetical protein